MKTTDVYAVKGKQKLHFDLYLPDQYLGEKRELVILLHRGDFASGTRNGENETTTCEYLCEQGYVVASMDYRLGLLSVPFRPDTILKAVQMGIDDLVTMTNYAQSHAEEWNIDLEHVVLVASGAGAVIALTAEYELCNGRLKGLPGGFNYAFMVANTGAIATAGEQLRWGKPSCPTMLIISERSTVVPEERFFVPGLLLVGGQHLYQAISNSGADSLLYDLRFHAETFNKMDIKAVLKFFLQQSEKVSAISTKERPFR